MPAGRTTYFVPYRGRPARRLEVTERIGFAEQPVGPFDSGEAGYEKRQRFPFQSFGPEADFSVAIVSRCRPEQGRDQRRVPPFVV